MRELSQKTLGRVRYALYALEPEGEYSSGEKLEFWKRTLFDAGFAPAFIDTAATYQFNWTEIIPHLYTGKFGNQNQTFAAVVPPDVGELYLNRLVAFALEQSKDTPIGEQVRESLQDDGFPISSGLQTDAPTKKEPPDKIPSSPVHPAANQDDWKFARLAIEEARKSVPEPDGRPHPNVGAVVVKDGKILATAHRGEAAGNHAEYIALEKRLPDAAVAGATVYTTLEPCTTRNHPKIPCAERLIERKVARVVMGMLDPDPRITGRGQRKLRGANIITDFFPHDLMTEVEELNRDFTRVWEQQSQTGLATAIPVLEQLKQFAAENKMVLIRPLIPPQFNPDFQVLTFHPNQVTVRKLSSSQLVSIPSGRVSEILWGFPTELPTLVLGGRIQWVTIPMEWRFFPDLPPPGPDGHLGCPRNVGGLQDLYLREIERQLAQTPYGAHWFRRENLPTPSGAWPLQDWQPFYDSDGRYLVCRHGHEALIFSVRIRK